MWSHQSNNFFYNTYVLNSFPYFPYQAYPFQTIQPYKVNSSFPQNQSSFIQVQKSYRETLQEIEQKPIKTVRTHQRKRVQKSRNMLKKVNYSLCEDREDNFERKKQKKDRNLPSNICRYFISYLYNHPCPQTILKTFKQTQTNSIIKSCIQQVKTHIKPSQTYIRPLLIQQMCRSSVLGEKQSLIFRILFQRYINTQFRMLISTVKKLTKKQKVSYFKLGRKFANSFAKNQ